MKLVKLASLILVITFNCLINYIPVNASELDKECASFCKNNGYEDGHYLPQEPGAKCEDGYEQSVENQICCCK